MYSQRRNVSNYFNKSKNQKPFWKKIEEHYSIETYAIERVNILHTKNYIRNIVALTKDGQFIISYEIDVSFRD